MKKIKICFFNTENLFLVGDPKIVPIKPQDKLQWIARTLLEIDADIFMLCEVGGKESLDLLNGRYLKNNYCTHLLPGNSDRGIEMGYLIKKSVCYQSHLNSHKDRLLNLKYSENEQMPFKLSRDISELTIKDSQNQVAMILLLVHLKSKLDRDSIDPLSIKRRKAELDCLIDVYLEKKHEFPNAPIIVAGDFNGVAQKANCDFEFLEIYKKTPLEDILEVISEPSEKRHTYLYFDREEKRIQTQLDYLFLPPELHPKVIKEESGIYFYRGDKGQILPLPQSSFERYGLPSDHYPIVATFTFPL